MRLALRQLATLLLPWAVAACASPSSQDSVVAPAEAAGVHAQDLPSAATEGGLVDLAELSAEVRDRVDALLAASRRDLAALQAAHDAARDNARALVARLQGLEREVQARALQVSGLETAGGSLKPLLASLTALEGHSQQLLGDLAAAQASLDDFERRADEVLAETPAATADETLQRATLATLDSEAVALRAGLGLERFEERADLLVAEVALLGGRVEESSRQVERQLALVARHDDGSGGEGAGGEARAADSRAATAAAEPQQAAGSVDAALAADLEHDAGEIAEVVTNRGTLLLEFFPDVAPNHVANFKRLVRDGFYDGLGFHRVIPGFLAQAGCPLGNGSGGPGWEVAAEFNERPHRRGTLSMARFGHPDSAGSQFFICLTDRPELDGKFTVFGRVIRGETALAAIESLGTVQGTPEERIVIERIVLRPWKPGDNEQSMIAGNPVRQGRD